VSSRCGFAGSATEAVGKSLPGLFQLAVNTSYPVGLEG